MKVNRRTTEEEYVLTLSKQEYDDLRQLLKRACAIGDAESYRLSAMCSVGFPEDDPATAVKEPPLTVFAQLARKVYLNLISAGYRL